MEEVSGQRTHGMGASPRTRAPLQAGGTVEGVCRSSERSRGEGGLAGSGRQDSAPAGNGRHLPRATQARRQRHRLVQPHSGHPAHQRSGDGCPGRATRSERESALARYHCVAAEKGRSRRVGRGKDCVAPARGQSLHRQVLQPSRGHQVLRGDPGDRSGQSRGRQLPQADVRKATGLGAHGGRASSGSRSHRGFQRSRRDVGPRWPSWQPRS